jgi:4-hydroxybenzoate polyprenyltransferase
MYAGVEIEYFKLFSLSVLGIFIISWCMLRDDYETYDDDVERYTKSRLNRYKPCLAGTHTRKQLYWLSWVCLIIVFLFMFFSFRLNLIAWILIAVAYACGILYIKYNKKYLAVEIAFTFPIGIIMFIIAYLITSNIFLSFLFLVWETLIYAANTHLADVREAKTSEYTIVKWLGCRYDYKTGTTYISYKCQAYLISAFMGASIIATYIIIKLGFSYMFAVLPVILFVLLITTLRTTTRNETQLKKIRLIYNYFLLFGSFIPVLLVYPLAFMISIISLLSFLFIYNKILFNSLMHNN